MDNAKKIKIMDRVSDIVRSQSLITIPTSAEKYEYLVEMLQSRLIVIGSVPASKYVWPFYLERQDFIQLVFPTPPFEPKLDNKLKRTLDDFVKETRKCIAEIIAKNPPKIVLDLRNNFGGFLYVFYNALLPLLPLAEDQELVYGVDKAGETYMTMLNQAGKMILQFPNGQEVRELYPVSARPKCKVELWVNSRSASSSELIMVLCAQEGYRVLGRPTLGLTTGMSSIELPDGEFNYPSYVFMDKHKKIYQPDDSNITIGEKTPESLTGPARKLCGNVLVELPPKVLDMVSASPSIPVFNHLISEYFSNNYHCGIDYDKSPLSYCITKTQLYIHVPKKCKTKISSVLDEFQDRLEQGLPVLIDIRNAILGDKKEDFMFVFDGLYKPWKAKSETGTAYIGNSTPYIFGKAQTKTGKYSNIKANFWVNPFSISGNLQSCLFLLFVKDTFGLYPESTLSDHYDYSLHPYKVDNIEAQVYSNHWNPSPGSRG